MDFTTIKDMSIGNLKITSIYYNNNILYQDTPIQYLTFLQFGTAVVTNTIIEPIILNTIGSPITFIEFGTAVTTNIIT